MARDKITICEPALDVTKSVCIGIAAATTINTTNGAVIENAFDNKDNSFHIVVNATTAGTVTLKAGNEYPNAILGDLAVSADKGLNIITVEDLMRFENKDGSLNIDFDTVAGSIYAVAKHAGLKTV